MSKLICDVCGTAYPETATACPICGCAKTGSTQPTAADPGQKSGTETSTGYTYVKGGRFSKRNVRRRNQGSSVPERRTEPRQSTSGTSRQSSAVSPRQSSVSTARQTRAKQKEEQTNRGLMAVVVILLLAIIAVVIYIFVRIFGPGTADPNPSETGPQSSTQQSESTESTGDTGSNLGVPCTNLELSNKTIEFTASGPSTWQLLVNPVPADTTDVIEFASSDDSIVTVDQTGLITAVGSGNAVITVKCGDIIEECAIISSIGGGNTDNPVDPNFVFEFNTPFKDSTTGYYDTTLGKKGDTWRAYKNDMSVAVEDIRWLSDDPSICTIENGVVTAVAPGTTKVYAVYGGKTYTCIVRCSFEATPDVPDTGYSISHTDVTIAVDETFSLRLTDAQGNAVAVTWTTENETLVSINGNKITGKASGMTEVYCTYEGVTYTCTVRVK